MAFQSTVFINQGAGIQGDKYSDSPWRAQSFTLRSSNEADNIIGAAMYTKTSEGIAEAGSGGVNGFAGLLVNSKVYANAGTVSGGTLDASVVLKNETQAELATMGQFWVILPAAAAIGDLVVYDNFTGALSTIAPAAALPAGTSFGFAKVDVREVTAPGLAIIEMSPTFVIPV